MPTMFDSHEEFNEWFSKDIESHAEKKSALDENQLSRLHMILKPFMLRRIKRDGEHEMADKVGGRGKEGEREGGGEREGRERREERKVIDFSLPRSRCTSVVSCP